MSAMHNSTAEQSQQTTLLLCCCGPNGETHDDFHWPLEIGAIARIKNWDRSDPTASALHGWLHGKGNIFRSNPLHLFDGKWLVAEALVSEIVDIDGYCRFPRATIRFVGGLHDAATFLISHEPQALPGTVIGGHLIASDADTATVGHKGLATAGRCGNAIAGNYGCATVGDYGNAVVGDFGIASAGNFGRAKANDIAVAAAGKGGTAITGLLGTSVAGDHGLARTGTDGIAIAGILGSASAGQFGALQIKWYDASTLRHRVATAYVGEDGILPDVVYQLDSKGRFVAAKEIFGESA